MIASKRRMKKKNKILIMNIHPETDTRTCQTNQTKTQIRFKKNECDLIFFSSFSFLLFALYLRFHSLSAFQAPQHICFRVIVSCDQSLFIIVLCDVDYRRVHMFATDYSRCVYCWYVTCHLSPIQYHHIICAVVFIFFVLLDSYLICCLNILPFNGIRMLCVLLAFVCIDGEFILCSTSL